MSSFGGKIEKLPGISIDNFEYENRDSDIYFISHCHSDHMKGLHDPFLQENLAQRKAVIYVSSISKLILKKMYPIIENNLVELDMYSPTTLYLKDIIISVIPIPAGHCPGSVMFLFQVDDTNILYTGDYRINSLDIPKIKAFYANKNVVKIEELYLDTTFFLKSKYSKFPTRDDSLNEICNVIKNWISNGKDYVINLHTSAKYAYEFLFIEIFKQLSLPIHLNIDAYNIYKHIPDLDGAITLNKNKTQIHSYCCGFRNPICCWTLKVKEINVSAFRWDNKRFDSLETISEEVNSRSHVCYSTHASYEEGEALIRFLRPKKIFPCVQHQDENLNQEILDSINELLEEFKEDKEDAEPGLIKEDVKLFSVDKGSVSPLPTDRKEYDEFDYLLDSPPAKRKK